MFNSDGGNNNEDKMQKRKEKAIVKLLTEKNNHIIVDTLNRSLIKRDTINEMLGETFSINTYRGVLTYDQKGVRC